MTLYETIDAIHSLRSLIFNIWNMFVAVHITIVGGFLFVNRRISLSERLVAYLAYLGFMLMNWRAQLDNYGLLDVLVSRARVLEEGCLPEECLFTALPTLASPQLFLGAIYGSGALATFLIVMLINVISRKEER